jgi:tetratricopeptide (TPR) repeat protein
MVRLGEAYQALGKTEQAIALFEKALGMRAWSRGSDYGAVGELERFYRQTNSEDKLIALLTDHQGYTAIKGYYDQQKQPEKFKQYLINQIEKKPTLQLRFCLGEYYLNNKDSAAAAQIYERLYAELAAEEGNIPNRGYALKLAEAFANLGNVKNASRILLGIDYENDRDRNDRTGSVLMRTYAKIGQFDKALEVCTLRLKKDPDGHRTLNIAEQIAEGSRACANGPPLLDSFLEQVKEDIAQRQYQRFRGAVKAYLAAHPAEGYTEHVTIDALTLLRDGRRVEVPKDCRSFADFLEKLAFQADTVATQSFMHEYGKSRRPARLKAKSGSAFEILAEALDGDNIPMEMTQDGYWAFYESGDKNKKYIYAGRGGMFCKLQPFNHLPDGKNIYALGQVFFEPAVQRHVASIQSLFEVVEAIDGTGSKMTPPQAGRRWDYSTQIEIMLGKPSLFTRNIKQLRVKTAVALCTKWATFNVNRLDHTQPIVLEKDNVRIQIDPIAVSTLGKPCWEMPIDIKAKDIKLVGGGDFQAELKDQFRFLGKDGRELRPDCYRTSPSGGQTKITVRTDINAFDPAAVSLFIKRPAAIEIVPFEMTFHNVPIIKR